MTERPLSAATLSPATTPQFAAPALFATAATHPFSDQRVRCLTFVALDRRPNRCTTQATSRIILMCDRD